MSPEFKFGAVNPAQALGNLVVQPVHFSYMRAIIFTLTLLLVLASCKSDRSPGGAERERVFTKAAEVLDGVASSENIGIPDAVLNRTRCLVLLPAGADQGVVSCFEALNRWTRPDLIVFKGQRRSTTSDLFIFVLGPAEAKSVRSGRLDLGEKQSTSAGPTVRSKAVITDADLSFGSLVYERQGGVVTGAKAQGTVSSAGPARTDKSTSESDQQLQRSLASFFNAITPSGIIIHHTADLPTSRKVPGDTTEVDAYHLQKGFDAVCFGREYHVAYHYLILENGSVQAGRPERCQGAHATGYNAYLGISLAGDFSSRHNPNGSKGPASPTPKQQQSLVQLCRRLQEHYKFPVHRIMRHSDVAPTECPGDRFPFVQILQSIGR